MSKTEIAEQIVIKWFSEQFPDYPISTQKPKNLPSKFAVLRRDGGERDTKVMDIADLQIEIYDKDSEFNCATVASDVCDKIEDSLASYDKDIAKTKVYGASNIGDERLQYFSYLIDFSVWYRR